ncbi:MAG: hypothetical protein MN733_13450 [Nitrososphaera sp.]|nr:hypothetical protein [Nitrososphaera sp.]
MALVTLGTQTQTTLQALQWSPQPVAADLAAINALFKYQSFTEPSVPGPVSFIPVPMINQGVLYVPERGQLKLYPGDYIAADPITGHFVLISAATAAATSWIHT